MGRLELAFDADFENGSVGRVVQLGINWYHIELSPDTWYWFHFRVRGCMNREIIFQFSCRDIPEEKEGMGRWWFPPDVIIKPMVSYDGSTWKPVNRIEKDRTRWGTYRFVHKFEEDEAYLCHSHPYTYSDLMAWIETVKSSPLVKMESIGLSRNGVNQPLMTVGGSQKSGKELVAIIAREDSDEMTSSFALEGVVRWLLSEKASGIRQRYTFKIVPMVCVDGVIAGGTESAGYGYGGYRWHENPSPHEIENVKTAFRDWLRQGFRLVLAGKLHGATCLFPTPELALSHNDILLSDPALRDALVENTDDFWRPYARDLVIRPKGFFERFLLDEFGFRTSFGVHVQGHSVDAVRGCGEGMMKAIEKYLANTKSL